MGESGVSECLECPIPGLRRPGLSGACFHCPRKGPRKPQWSLPWPRTLRRRAAGPRAQCTASRPSQSKPPSPPASPSRAPGCRLQERERERQSGVSKATEAESRVARGDRARGPYRSLEAGDGGLATWLERCDTVRAALLGARRALVPALGTSPRAGPGDSPAGGGG